MTRPSWIIANFILFLTLFLIAASFQSSFLHWVLGWKVNIQIVIVLLTYICLYREQFEALLFTVFACYFLGLMSTMYTSTTVFAGVCLWIGLRALRRQIYSSNAVYFTWTSLASILGFHLITWLTTIAFESRRLRMSPLDLLLEVLMTALFAKPLYLFFIFLDKKTRRYTVTELNS